MAAEAEVKQARAARAEIEARLQAVIERRGKAERALAERAERHDALARRVYEARSARERLGLRAEQVGASAQALARRIERVELELSALSEAGAETNGRGTVRARSTARLRGRATSASERWRPSWPRSRARREQEIEREIEGLEGAREREAARVSELEDELGQAREARARADELAEQARVRLQAAEREVQDTRREAARVGGELAVANQFLRSHASVGDGRARVDGVGGVGGVGGPDSTKALSEELGVRDGYELALAAALGGRLERRAGARRGRCGGAARPSRSRRWQRAAGRSRGGGGDRGAGSRVRGRR